MIEDLAKLLAVFLGTFIGVLLARRIARSKSTHVDPLPVDTEYYPSLLANVGAKNIGREQVRTAFVRASEFQIAQRTRMEIQERMALGPQWKSILTGPCTLCGERHATGCCQPEPSGDQACEYCSGTSRSASGRTCAGCGAQWATRVVRVEPGRVYVVGGTLNPGAR